MTDEKAIPRHNVTIKQDDAIPNYMTGIKKALEDGTIDMDALKGKVSMVNVFHDDWCKIYNGGNCNCNCEVQVRPLEEEDV